MSRGFCHFKKKIPKYYYCSIHFDNHISFIGDKSFKSP